MRQLKEGDEVRIHPASDLFMRGVVYATITKVGRKWVTLRHHRSKTTHKVSFDFAENYFLESP